MLFKREIKTYSAILKKQEVNFTPKKKTREILRTKYSVKWFFLTIYKIQSEKKTSRKSVH